MTLSPGASQETELLSTASGIMNNASKSEINIRNSRSEGRCYNCPSWEITAAYT